MGMDGEEKARMLARRQEIVTIQKICRRTKGAGSLVMALLTDARDLPHDVISATKPRSGRPPQTSNTLMMY